MGTSGLAIYVMLAQMKVTFAFHLPFFLEIVFFGGLMINSQPIMWIGALMFGASSLFAVITLPVEFDASRRALKHLEGMGILSDERELAGARQVLRAAAWTYVAAAAAGILQLIYLIARFNDRR